MSARTGSESMPQAKGVPLMGNTHQLLSDPLEFLIEQYGQLGPVFRLSAPGKRLVALVGHEANALLANDNGDLFSSEESWQQAGEAFSADNPIIFGASGAAHATMRTDLADGYGAEAVQARLSELIDDQLRLMRAWPRGKAFPAVPCVRQLIATLAIRLALGQTPDGFPDQVAYFLRRVTQIYVMAGGLGPLKLWRHMPSARKLRRSMLDVYQGIWDAPGSSDRPEDAPCFIEHVKRFHAEHPDVMTKKDAMAAIDSFLSGAIVAMESPVAFFVYHVARNPELMREITEEADAAFADGLPTMDALRQMDKTRRAAMETLRLHPPVPVMVRFATKDFEFAGFGIPAGEQCLVANAVTHFMPDVFPHPNQFDIGRFAPERSEHEHPHAYSPYGLGVHDCVGEPVAATLFLLIAAVLFHHLEIELQPADQELNVTILSRPGPDNRFRIAVAGERHSLRS